MSGFDWTVIVIAVAALGNVAVAWWLVHSGRYVSPYDDEIG